MIGREILIPSSVAVETDRKVSIGVALVIVGIDPSRNGENAEDPKVWTVIEKKSKSETEKIVGQISFPGETRKNGESLSQNIIGALLEVTDNTHLVGNNLFYLPDSSHIEGGVSIKSNPIDLVVLIYNGSLEIPLVPVDDGDVKPNRWMTIDEINQVLRQDQDTVRKFSRDILNLETSENRISRVVKDYLHFPWKRVPFSKLLPSTFSTMKQFHEDREKLSDVVAPNLYKAL